jgi:ribosomal protein L37AE/L43A
MISQEFILRRRTAAKLFLSVFILVACGLVVYFLETVDGIVNGVLYRHGLQFSYDWASPYWLFIRTALALIALIALATSTNIAFSFWESLKQPTLTRITETLPQPLVVQPEPELLFQCTSCRNKTTNPVKFNVYFCPSCNAVAVPVSYAHGGKMLAEPQLEQLKTVVRSYLKAGILTLDELRKRDKD